MFDERPTHIDLFSGIGGFALAAQWAGFRTVAFVEIDKYCQKVLTKNFGSVGARTTTGFLSGRNMADSERPWELQPQGTEQDERRWTGNGSAEIHSNIFDFDGTAYRNCDLLTGGFPCQPFSVAGKRRGAADDRAIWPEMFRVITQARPAWVLGENVPGLIPMELDNVLSDLESIGYATRSFVIPACAVDARHRRDRLWIVAKSNAERCGRRQDNERQTSPERNWPESASCDAADAESKGLERFGADSGQPQITEPWNGSALAYAKRNGERAGLCEDEPRRIGRRRSGDSGSAFCEWQPEPDVGRVAHGIPSRVDRLKGLGNAIVPQVAYEILREIRKLI